VFQIHFLKTESFEPILLA